MPPSRHSASWPEVRKPRRRLSSQGLCPNSSYSRISRSMRSPFMTRPAKRLEPPPCRTGSSLQNGSLPASRLRADQGTGALEDVVDVDAQLVEHDVARQRWRRTGRCRSSRRRTAPSRTWWRPRPTAPAPLRAAASAGTRASWRASRSQLGRLTTLVAIPSASSRSAASMASDTSLPVATITSAGAEPLSWTAPAPRSTADPSVRTVTPWRVRTMAVGPSWSIAASPRAPRSRWRPPAG